MREMLTARDVGLGLGRAGPLVSAAHEAASSPDAPEVGVTILEVDVDAAGKVVRLDRAIHQLGERLVEGCCRYEKTRAESVRRQPCTSHESMLQTTRTALATIALATLVACGASSSDEGPSGEHGPSTVTSDAPPAPVEPTPVTPEPTVKTVPFGPVGEWTWLDVDGASCGLGHKTGFAVNEGSGSDVIIYLEGGGLCWDEISCHVDIPNFVPLASFFMTGYNGDTFRGNPPRSGIFDRSHPSNPFKNATIVYVPYCTGDFHTGTTTQPFPSYGLTAHYSGRTNLDLYLERFLQNHPVSSRVTLAGTSAGGFGALINFGHVHDIFGKTRVDLISDSAPALWMQAPIFTGLAAWNFGAALPKGCPDCARDLRGLYAYYAGTYPDSRLAVTTFDSDFAMSVGGYLLPFPRQFSNAINVLTNATLASLPNFRAFVPSGQTHGMLYNLDVWTQTTLCTTWIFGYCTGAIPTSDPSTLGQWLTRMETDDPTWASLSGIPQ